MLELNKIYCMDAISGMKEFPDNYIDLAITSPPYYSLRIYSDSPLEVGNERTDEEYINNLVDIFEELRRILKPTGSFFLNIGDIVDRDNKQQLMIPERLALKMKEKGWILRKTIIWEKLTSMPSSVKDTFTNRYEHIFHFVKNKEYYFDLDSIRIPHKISQTRLQKLLKRDERLVDKDKIDLLGDESKYKQYAETNIRADLPIKKQNYHPLGKNPGNIWKIRPDLSKEKHIAVYPEKLCEMPIKACCPSDGIVLDMFSGSGTTAVIAKKFGRHYIGFDVNPKYVEMATKRLENIKEGILLKKDESSLKKWVK